MLMDRKDTFEYFTRLIEIGDYPKRPSWFVLYGELWSSRKQWIIKLCRELDLDFSSPPYHLKASTDESQKVIDHELRVAYRAQREKKDAAGKDLVSVLWEAFHVGTGWGGGKAFSIAASQLDDPIAPSGFDWQGMMIRVLRKHGITRSKSYISIGHHAFSEGQRIAGLATKRASDFAEEEPYLYERQVR